jgi:hypothetical protein
MNKRSFVLVVIIVVAALLAAPAWNFQQDKRDIQAHIIKVVRDVERKSTTGWSKAVTTDQLKSGQEVRTGEKSLAIILFADQSKVAVREKSVITIAGEMQGRQIINRDVFIERGRVVFGVKKQQTEQFRFTSPISVASIRGTEGGTGFDPAAGEADITIVVGSAEFRNTRSNQSTTVNSGQTAVADSAGNVTRQNANRNQLNNNDPNSNVNQGGGGTGGGSGGSGGTGGTGGGVDSTATRHDSTSTGTAAKFSLSLPSVMLTSGQGVRFQISLVNKPTEIAQGTLRYRIQGDPTFKQATLNISADNATVDIPGNEVRAGATKTFEYYISMLGADGKSYTFPEDNPESNPYTLPVKPRTVEILVPVNDPSGTLKYIKISYVE